MKLLLGLGAMNASGECQRQFHDKTLYLCGILAE